MSFASITWDGCRWPLHPYREWIWITFQDFSSINKTANTGVSKRAGEKTKHHHQADRWMNQHHQAQWTMKKKSLFKLAYKKVWDENFGWHYCPAKISLWVNWYINQKYEWNLDELGWCLSSKLFEQIESKKTMHWKTRMKLGWHCLAKFSKFRDIKAKDGWNMDETWMALSSKEIRVNCYTRKRWTKFWMKLGWQCPVKGWG